MPEDEKQPADADETKGEAADGDEAPPMNRAERRARKHKRKGELRQLHDRSRANKRDTKGHLGRIHRRKAI